QLLLDPEAHPAPTWEARIGFKLAGVLTHDCSSAEASGGREPPPSASSGGVSPRSPRYSSRGGPPAPAPPLAPPAPRRPAPPRQPEGLHFPGRHRAVGSPAAGLIIGSDHCL